MCRSFGHQKWLLSVIQWLKRLLEGQKLLQHQSPPLRHPLCHLYRRPQP